MAHGARLMQKIDYGPSPTTSSTLVPLASIPDPVALPPLPDWSSVPAAAIPLLHEMAHVLLLPLTIS